MPAAQTVSTIVVIETNNETNTVSVSNYGDDLEFAREHAGAVRENNDGSITVELKRVYGARAARIIAARTPAATIAAFLAK